METKTKETSQTMTPRVAALRQLSVDTKPYISGERAVLLTEFYQSGVPLRESVPVTRALAFRYLAENKSIFIGDGELIVGERGPAPKATPTYPELCCHDLEDLHILDSRDRTPFEVSDEVRKVYEERIIPFWSGRSIRDRIFNSLKVKRPPLAATAIRAITPKPTSPVWKSEERWFRSADRATRPRRPPTWTTITAKPP